MKQRGYGNDFKQLFSASTFDRLRGILAKYQEDLLAFKKMFGISVFFLRKKKDMNLPFKKDNFLSWVLPIVRGLLAVASQASFRL